MRGNEFDAEHSAISIPTSVFNLLIESGETCIMFISLVGKFCNNSLGMLLKDLNHNPKVINAHTRPQNSTL